MSPNEQKMTSGRAAISSALSITSSGVTQTGQPGPWISSIPSGSSWSSPCRMIEWVCPPQTSIIAQGWVAVAWMSSSSRLASSGSWNSSRYFIAGLPLRPVRPGCRCLHAGRQVGSRQSGLLGRAAPLVAELGVELAHLAEEVQGLQGGLLVEPLEGEPDVHDRVLTDLQVGDVLQADLLGDPAEVHLRDPGPVALADLQDLSWDG